MKFENFNDLEALKIAINMENEGLEFYTILTENAQSDKTKKIFAKLANDEKDHLNTFQNIYDVLASKEVDSVQGCEDYTIDLYLRDLIDTGVFTRKGQAKQVASTIKTDIDALKIGIQVEKDAILYYREAAQHTKNKEGKKMFGKLVEEEKKHLNLLAHYMKVVKENP